MQKSKENFFLSIIIPVHNREDILYRTLSKLYYETRNLKDVEILVIDDGSTDSTQEICKEFNEKNPEQFNYYYKQNSGPSAARNIGIKKATGDVILFLDSDIVPSDDLIPEHIKFHSRYMQENYVMRGTTRNITKKSETYRITEISEVKSQNDDNEYIEISWEDFRSGNLSIKRNFLINNEVFDEDMITKEDIELGYRLGKRGLRLFHNNKAIGYHYHPVDLNQYFRYAEKYGKSLAIWYSKEPRLKKKLKKLKFRNENNFLYWSDPVFLIKYFLRMSIISIIGSKFFISLGEYFKKKNKKIFWFFNRQIYQYLQKRAFIKYLKEIKADDLKLKKSISN